MHPHSMAPLVGASGAIAGAMGAYFILYPAANITTFIYGRMIDIPAVLYLGFWIVMQVISSHFDMSRGEGGGIAWFGHIGGFAFGALVAVAIKYAVPAWRREKSP